MKVKLWGTRGSIPTPKTPEEIIANTKSIVESYTKDGGDVDSFISNLSPFQLGGLGGDTTCVEVMGDNGSFFIDGGSGIRRAGLSMLGGDAGKGKAVIHIYLTHFHWDHLVGLPFFVPIFIPGNEIHFYSVDPILEESIKMIFKKPYFPVPFEALGADIHFHQIEGRKKTQINGVDITPYKLDHPDPCWGLRVEDGGKVYSHCVDTEGTRISREQLGEDLPLYQDVDVMYWDAQYSLKELFDKIDWGHSATTIGLDLAFRENIKKIVFTHHEPAASDKKLEELYKQTEKYYQFRVDYFGPEDNPEWCFAHDGMVLDI